MLVGASPEAAINKSFKIEQDSIRSSGKHLELALLNVHLLLRYTFLIRVLILQQREAPSLGSRDHTSFDSNTISTCHLC